MLKSLDAILEYQQMMNLTKDVSAGYIVKKHIEHPREIVIIGDRKDNPAGQEMGGSSRET